MPGFTNEDELHKYVGGIFETAMKDPDISGKLFATGLILRVETSDPELYLTIDMPGKTTHKGKEGPEPHATMKMSSEMANEYWQGKVNLPFAMARGKVKVEGNITKLLQLAPLGKKLYPVYKARLEEDGRTDLLVS